MFVSGQLIAILTFPGVIVHEAAHQLFCRFFRVAVLDVCYFQIGNPAGYVVHESAVVPGQHIWITGDAEAIWQTLQTRKISRFTKLIGTPIVYVIYLGAFGSVVWLDLLYGIAVATFLPNLMIWLCA